MREGILGYPVVFHGPELARWVAGVAIAGLTDLAKFSGFPGILEVGL